MDAVQSSQLTSKQVLARHGKSFYWASFFLPKRNKDAATKLYSICRFFDDLADDNNEDQTKILKGEFPISEEIHRTTLSLPISYFHTKEDVLRVCKVINANIK